MMALVYVFIGGGLGSVLRYLIGRWSTDWHVSFPFGTWIANVMACLMLGCVVGYIIRHGEMKELYLLLAVGFCGGFSTFSTFSLESVQLWQNGDYVNLGLNVLLSLVVCFGAVFLGMYLVSSKF